MAGAGARSTLWRVRIALSNPDVDLTGGVERVIVETANRLSRRGHHVTVYAARADESVLDGAVRVSRVPVPGRADLITGLGFRRRCARAIRADRPDVHAAFSSLSPLGGVFWVPSVHRVGYELLLSRRGRLEGLRIRLNPYHWVRLRLEAGMFGPGGCRLALAQTETVRAEVRRCYGDATEVGVLALGYDEEAFDSERRLERRAEARRALGYAPQDTVALFVANELERKGLDVLLEAARTVPEVKILGAGRVTPSAEMLDRAGVTDRVRWVGHAADVGELHAAADALVLPTRYEPWGLVIVEALGSGLPVLTTRLAGAAVAVRDGESGVLLDDPEDAEALASGLRSVRAGGFAPPREISESVRAFAWPRVIDRFEQILGEIARERAAATVAQPPALAPSG